MRDATQAYVALATTEGLGPMNVVLTGTALSSIAVADFDGDGRPDIVAADVKTNQLFFLRSKGDGTFDPPVVTTLNVSPVQIAAADFDGDGRIDLAVRGGGLAASVAVDAADATGHFTERSRTTIATAAYLMTVGDIDGDGRPDLLIARSDLPGFDIYYNGTIALPQSIPATIMSSAIAIADLNHDGRAEILSLESHSNTLTVYRNIGGRAFGSPVTIFAAIPGATFGSGSDLVVTDVDGDGTPDVVVAVTDQGAIATFIGNGDGSLAPPQFSNILSLSISDFYPAKVVAGTFTGASSLALLDTTGNGVRVVANATGGSSIGFVLAHPVISVGQPATVTASVNPASGFATPIGAPAPPFPVGAVSLQEGATVLASSIPVNRDATLVASSLPAGVHNLSVQFAGDAAYRASSSRPIVQTVVAQKTTTTLTNSSGGNPVTYGYGQLSLTADVQSPIAGNLQSNFVLYVDGVRTSASVNGPPAVFKPAAIAPGTHTFAAEYQGNAAQPPSMSNTVTQVIQKAPSSIAITNAPLQVSAYQPPTIHVTLNGPFYDTSSLGGVSILEGTQVLKRVAVSQPATGGNVSMDVILPSWTQSGTHLIHAAYDGDNNYLPSVSVEAQVTVTLRNSPPPHGHAARH